MAQQQSSRGYFGEFGGQFAPETLMPALQELEQAYNRICRTRQFTTEYNELLTHYNGRPTPLYHAKNLTARCGGAQIYLKREDLNHTGAHKITNSLGQALLARQMGKTRLIAETGAGQHGVATATVAALLGMECDIYMGAIDMARQSPNVFRMRLLGARVISVDSGGQTLKDAINEAMRDWSKSVRTTHYVVGSALCAHPFPSIVRDFQSIIGKETKKQLNALTGRLPDEIVACVGGGSNAIGIFAPFLEETQVTLTGVEAGGHGVTTRKHAARLCGAKSSRKGILHGSFSFVLQDRNGQIADTHSISAGLDYSAIGPQHAFLHTSGRATYTNATDKEALEAFGVLCRTEGIIPALESSHAIAYALKRAPQMSAEQILVVNLSGRGDKDIFHVAQQMGTTI